MKYLRYLLVFTVALVFVAGCAKKPEQEIQDAKAAVEAASKEGLEKYAPEDAKKLNDALTAALDEVKVQEGKTFKNYDKAKQMLADVKKQAEEMKAQIPAKKEAAKQNAVKAQEEAKAAVEEAKKLLAKAPKGKGTAADIEALKGDVKGLEDSMTEISGLIEKEEFSQAASKASAVKEKATNVANQIKEAMEKAKAAKPAKK